MAELYELILICFKPEGFFTIRAVICYCTHFKYFQKASCHWWYAAYLISWGSVSPHSSREASQCHCSFDWGFEVHFLTQLHSLMSHLHFLSTLEHHFRQPLLGNKHRKYFYAELHPYAWITKKQPFLPTSFTWWDRLTGNYCNIENTAFVPYNSYSICLSFFSFSFMSYMTVFNVYTSYMCKNMLGYVFSCRTVVNKHWSVQYEGRSSTSPVPKRAVSKISACFFTCLTIIYADVLQIIVLSQHRNFGWWTDGASL